jgi:flagellar basal-body rod modification protein FlgD
MATTLTPVAATGSTAASTPATAAAAGASGTDTAQAQDRFLKLLVAQLNNQDPMNPMDNAQMTSQMAQINTVTGIQQLNDTMKSMTAQYASMQLMQGASLVGREVLTSGNTLTLDGKTGKGSIDLTGPASSVKVDVLSAGGQVVGTVNLGPQSAGRSDFSWDAKGYTGGGTLTFKVTADNAGQKVEANPLMREKVTSVGMDKGAPVLQLSGGSRVSANTVVAVL